MSINSKLLLQVKLAVAVALSDNEFSDSEIKYIKKWFNNKIIDYPEREKNRLLKDFNNELSTLKELSEFDELSLEDVFYELKDIDDRSFKYEALDLSIEVMVADSSIHPKEIELIAKVVDQLDLNYATSKKYIRNQILKMNKPPKSIDIEGLLNIYPTVSNKDSRKLFRKELVIWNSATTSTQTDNQRKNAQVMIDIISAARERYV
jgi:hypothetical protein